MKIKKGDIVSCKDDKSDENIVTGVFVGMDGSKYVVDNGFLNHSWVYIYRINL